MFVWDLFQMAFYLHWIRIHFMVWTGQSVSCVVCARQKQQHTLCRQQFNNININDMYIYSFRTCVLFSTVLALPEAIQSCTKQCKHTKFVDSHEFWFMFFFLFSIVVGALYTNMWNVMKRHRFVFHANIDCSAGRDCNSLGNPSVPPRSFFYIPIRPCECEHEYEAKHDNCISIVASKHWEIPSPTIQHHQPEQ